jgi:mandelate racemase
VGCTVSLVRFATWDRCRCNFFRIRVYKKRPSERASNFGSTRHRSVLDDHGSGYKSVAPGFDRAGESARHPNRIIRTRNSCVQEHAVEPPFHDLASVRGRSDSCVDNQRNIRRAFPQFPQGARVAWPLTGSDGGGLGHKRLKLVGWQGFAGMVAGTLDMALWDALARAMDVPLAVLLGGEVRPLPAYDSFGTLDPRTDLPWLETSVASGFKAIKIKLGAGDVESDVAIVAAVRRTIGDGVRLMLDFNQSQSTASAVERIRRLQDFYLTWVEEPVAAEDLVGHRAVRDCVRPVPIQTGENWWFPHGMANAIAAGASDLAMVDIMKIGGITGWISAMAQAEAAVLPLSNHTFVEPSAHVMAVSPTASWFEYLDIAGAVLTERLVPVDGMVSARGPGLVSVATIPGCPSD